MKRILALFIVSLFLVSLAPVNGQGTSGYATGNSGIFFLEPDFTTHVSVARGVGEPVFIGMRDGGFTSNTVTVTVTSYDPDYGTNLETETIQLVRYASGNYRGVIGFETAASANNGKVYVKEGSVVQAQYAGSPLADTDAALNWFPSQTAFVNVDADHYGTEARIKVTVTDFDENDDPFARDYIHYDRVLLRSDSQYTFAGPANRDYLNLVDGLNPTLGAGLYETGKNTGIFEGTFGVESAYDGTPAHVNMVANPSAPPSAIPEGLVFVQDNDAIHITYSDLVNEYGRAEDVMAQTTWHRTHDALIELFDDENFNSSGMISVTGNNAYSGLQTMYIRLVDMDKRGMGNVQVRVASSSTGETGIVRILGETGPASGEFVGEVPLTLDGAGGIKVKHGDKLLVSYVDDRDGSGLAGTGNVFPDGGLNCGTPGLSKNDPSYFLQPCIFWVEAADASIRFITSADLDPAPGVPVPDDTQVSQLSGQLGAVTVAVMVDDPANQQASVTVHLTSDIDPLGFDLTLPKGDDGRYRGEFALQAPGADGFPMPEDDSAAPFALSDASGPDLYVADGNSIYAKYVDEADVNGDRRTITASAPYQTTTTGQLFLQKNRANGATDTVDVYLYDPDLNTGPVKDTATVTVTSAASPFPGIQLTLEEQGDVTHRNTGLFKGTLRFSTAASGSLPVGTVRVPDSSGEHSVSVTYADAFNSQGEAGGDGVTVTWQKSAAALNLDKNVYATGDSKFTIKLYTVGRISPETVTVVSRDSSGVILETDTVDVTWVAGTTVASKDVTFDVDGTPVALDGKLSISSSDAGRQKVTASIPATSMTVTSDYQIAMDPVGVNGANFARSVFDARQCTAGLTVDPSTTSTPLPDWINPESNPTPPETPYPALRATGNGDKQLCVQVTDADRNLHNGLIDTVQVTVTVKGIAEKVTLLEVDPTTGMPHPSSGTFRAYFGFDQAASVAGDSIFQATPLDSVLISYTDGNDPVGGNGPTYNKQLSWFPKYTGSLEMSRYDNFNETATSFEGAGKVYLRVIDNDRNTQGGVPDTLTVQACSETECGGFVPGAGNGWEDITLFETGQSTGVFEGFVELVDPSSSMYGIAGNGKLDVAEQGERIVVVYSDDTVTESVLYRGGNAEELKTLALGELTWVKTVSARASKLCRDEFCEQPIINDVAGGKPVFGIRTVWLEVTDDDRFADTSINTDTVFVRVVSDSDRNGISLELTETFGRSGVFRGSLGFTNKDSLDGSKIKVAHGDSFTIHYDNPTAVNAAGGVEDVVVIGDGIWRDGALGAISLDDRYFVGENDPEDDFEFPDTPFITIMDPDRNVLATVEDSLKQRIDPSDPFSGFESSVIVRSDSDPDGFRYQVTNDCAVLDYFCETGQNTGEFKDYLGFIQGITDDGSQRISVNNGDTVYIDYIDPQDFRGRQQVITKEMFWFETVGTGWIDIQDRYATESAVMNIVVRDQGLNKNSGATESAAVWVCSDSDNSCELVTLTEARRDDFSKPGVFSNTFVGTVGFETSFGARNGKVYVQDGDTVTVYYADENENFVRGGLSESEPGYYQDADTNPVPAAVVAHATWVLVDNVAPMAGLTASPTTVSGNEDVVTFTLTGSDERMISKWELDFGDSVVLMSDLENVDLSAGPVTVTHRYSNGTNQLTRQATLTVTDDGGLETDASVTITVRAREGTVLPPTGPTDSEIANANELIAESVVVRRTSEGNVITWILPNTQAAITGVQIHRSDDGGSTFTTIADLTSTSSDFMNRRYVDTQGTKDSTYMVTVYYANDVGKSATNPRLEIPGFGSAGATPVTESSDGGFLGFGDSIPWWGYLIMALVLLFLVGGIVLGIVLRQTTSVDEWDDEEEMDAGETEEAEEYAPPAAPRTPDDLDVEVDEEGMDDPATSEEVHHIKCPQCATGFTASGSKPLAINCPGCGAKGMLR